MFDTLIIQPIFNLLLGIYSLIPGGDFGIAIIIFTVLVRWVMWPLVKKQLHQTKAMQKMQPEMTRIKKECKGNRQLEAVQMMELYKKYDISPFRSIGLLFIQLPIFIALYRSIQIFTSHSNEVDKFTYGFLKGIEPIKQLIADPSSLNEKLFGLFDLTKQAIMADPTRINVFIFLLAIASALTQYIMSKQTMPKKGSSKSLREIMSEAADGKEANQAEMNAAMMSKMTVFLPIMMFFIMVNLPGALVLYYTVSNLIAVAQQGRILKGDAEEMIEIADKADDSKQHKKATVKARLKQAKEGKEVNITRIKAKETGFKKE